MTRSEKIEELIKIDLEFFRNCDEDPAKEFAALMRGNRRPYCAVSDDDLDEYLAGLRD